MTKKEIAFNMAYMKRLYGIGILLVLIFLFFLPVILKSHTVYGPADMIYLFEPWSTSKVFIPQNLSQGDALLQFMPWRKFAYEEIHKGRFPFWNPYSYGGVPFFANDQSSVFSIYNLFALLFPFEKGFLIIAMLKLIITGIGMYLFLDLFSLNIYACLLGSIAWTFSAFTITWLYSTTSSAGSFIPWFFYCFERLIRKVNSESKYTVFEMFGLSLSIGLSFFAGHAETTVNGIIGLVIYASMRILLNNRSIIKTLIYTGLGIIIGFFIASIQLFPFVQILFNSEPYWFRSYGMYLLHYKHIHIPLKYLVMLFVPNIMGNTSYPYFYSAGITGIQELVPYVGIAPLLMGIYAIRFIREEYRIILPSIFVIFFSISIAYNIPPVSLLGELPILKAGVNARYLIFVQFWLSLLAGFGMNKFSRQIADNKKLTIIIVTLVLSSTIAFLYYIIRHHIEWINTLIRDIPAPQSWFGMKPNTEQWSFILIQLFIAFFLVSFSSFLIFTHKIHGKLKGICLLIVTILDLFTFGIGYNPISSIEMVSPLTPLIDKLRSMNTSDYTFYAKGWIIPSNISMNYRIRDFRGYDIIVSMRYQKFLFALFPDVKSLLGEGGAMLSYDILPDPVVASISSIKYIITADYYNPDNSYYKLIGIYDDLALWDNIFAKPLIYVASNISSVTENQALELLSTHSPKLLNTTLVTDVDMNGHIDTDKIHFSYIENQPGRHIIAVDARTNGFLVINEPYYPGWHAYINDREVQMYHVNYLFQGIKLPPGNYTAEIIYKPRMFYFGLITSILTFLFMLFMSIAEVLRK